MKTQSSADVTFENAPPIATRNPAGTTRIVARGRDLADEREEDEPDLLAALFARIRALIRSTGSRSRV